MTTVAGQTNHAAYLEQAVTPLPGSATLALRVRRRWVRYRLRTLLVMMLVASLGLTWFVLVRRAARRQARAVETVLDLGGSVTYDFNALYEYTGTLEPRMKSLVPRWMLMRLGIDFFHDVVKVDMTSSLEPEIDLTFLEVLPEVQHVYLAPATTDEDLEVVAQFPDLDALQLSNSQVTDEGITHVLGLRELTMLLVDGSRITSSGLERLARLPSVRWLVVDPTQLDPRGVSAISRFPALESLWIIGVDITPLRLEGLEGLKLLALDGTESLEFDPQTHFPEVERLFIRSVSEETLDTVLVNLHRMPNLQKLEISVISSDDAPSRRSKTFLDDDRLRQISQLRRLWRLYIEDSPDVTDAGLEHMAELTNLRQLRLERVPVSGAGLQHLEDLQRLEELLVISPKLTAQQLKDAKAAMPDVEIQP